MAKAYAGVIMNVSERAAPIWPVLWLAAKNRQILTGDALTDLIGVPSLLSFGCARPPAPE